MTEAVWCYLGAVAIVMAAVVCAVVFGGGER